MYTILVAVDTDTDRAQKQADALVDLATANAEMEVVILHVFEENPEGASAQHVHSVRKIMREFDDAGLPYEISEQSGDPVDEILKEARQRDVDAICVGGGKRSPTGKALFGSVAQQVMLDGALPTLVIADEQ